MSQSESFEKTRITDDFSPIEMARAAINRWWLVSILTLLGGVFGWGISLAQPPLYEARASLLSSVDFSNTGELSQFEEDLAMDAVGSLLQSPEVISRVIEKAQQQDLQVTTQSFDEASFIERRLGIWELRVNDRSPQSAALLANIWLDEGYSVVEEAYRHALQASAQARYLESLEGCLRAVVVSETGGFACNGAELKEIQIEMRRVSSILAEERTASRGLISGVMLGEVQDADVPESPVSGARGGLTLAGAVIGLLLGFVLGQSNIQFRKRG